MKLALQTNHIVGQILYSPDSPKNDAIEYFRDKSFGSKSNFCHQSEM